MERPTCVCCGRKLPRTTERIDFSAADNIQSVAEAQRRTNRQIVAVKWQRPIQYTGDYDDALRPVAVPNPDEPDYIRKASVWDGRSWGLNGEGLFCTKECGYAFGRAVALRTRRT